jgi:uncharacterized protein
VPPRRGAFSASAKPRCEKEIVQRRSEFFVLELLPTLTLWALPLCGFVVGGLVGATGVGAGSLTTPLLVLGFSLNPAVAVGTDLLFAAITKLVGAAAHRKLGSVDARILRGLLLGSIPAALLTLAMLVAAPLDTPMIARGIKSALAVLLLATVIAILVRPLLQARWRAMGLTATMSVGSDSQSIQGPRHGAGPPPSSALHLIIVGACLGCAVAFTSIGAGSLGVVALAVVAPLLPARRIIGTDIAHAVPLTFICGAGHMALGHTDFRVLGLLLVGSLPGVLLGARLGRHLPDTIVRGLLAAALTLAAVMLLVK